MSSSTAAVIGSLLLVAVVLWRLFAPARCTRCGQRSHATDCPHWNRP